MRIESHTPPAPEPSRAEARKAQVLEAATECFRSQGFHGASMAQISKTAGMSVGHIYHYFENKEAIIAAIVERDLLNLITITDRLRSISVGGDLLQALVDDVDNCLEETTSDQNAPLMLEIIAEAARNESVAGIVRKADQAAMVHMRDFFREGLQRYGIHFSDAELDGPLSVLASLFEGLTVRVIRNPDLSVDSYLPVLKSVVAHVVQTHLLKGASQTQGV
ncbi:TetR/AcrR family transcriptional regulator [Denitratisoma sp. agr-D3]